MTHPLPRPTAPEPRLLLCASPGDPGKRASANFTVTHRRGGLEGDGLARDERDGTGAVAEPERGTHVPCVSTQSEASAASPVTAAAGSRNVGLRASAPRLSAYVFLARQTLQSPWEPVYAVCAAREARGGSPAVTPHAQSSPGC